MPFVEEVLQYESLSIVGLEKNTGKTECLNYLINRLPIKSLNVAVTSVGIDGERVDQVTCTHKPEIFLKEGILFTTSEKHYRRRRLLCELLEIDEEQTALGRLITARALTDGKTLLSGPSSTTSLIKWIENLKYKFEAKLCIIDGALSRLSLASPVVSQSMILTTGAALSIDIATLVRKTVFVVQLINLPITSFYDKNLLESKDQGIWIINNKKDVYTNPGYTSFSKDIPDFDNKHDIKAIYLSGALTDRFLQRITDSNFDKIELIVRDFTRIFVTPLSYKKFIAGGGKLSVLRKSKLIALCVNPVAPNGVVLDSEKLCSQIVKETSLPVYDIFKNGYKA